MVVGGGYAGAICAVRLARKARAADAEIVLVEARPWFVERIRLHEDVAGIPAARRSIASMLKGTRVRLHVATVSRIDLAQRRAFFDAGTGTTEAFDELVLATGSIASSRGVPGIERAWSCATEERALALRAHLDAMPGARVVVVGGGLTGVELVTELAGRRPDLRVTLVSSGEVAFMLSETGRAHVRRACAKAGVELREHTRVVAVEEGAVILASGDAVPSDATVWCGGFEAAPLAREAGIEVDEIGRAVVDSRLRSTSHDFVRVIGDAARVSMLGRNGLPQTLRMACATAVPQGCFTADDLAGRTDKPFSFAYFIQCVSLGPRDGILQPVDPYDAPKRTWIGGRSGAWLKELICRYPVTSIALERRGFGYSWPKAPALPPGSPAQLASRTM